MRKFDSPYNLFGLSYCAGAIYIFLTVFRGQYDAVLTAYFIILGNLGAIMYAWKKTARRTTKREHAANMLMILWAVIAIFMLRGSIGWTIYFTTLIIIPNVVSIWLRLMKTRAKSTAIPGT
jgi:hypothetical protein